MNYFSEMLRLPVVDAAGEKIGVVNDLGIATGEVFPRVTALAFQGPGKTPFMISWRKYVERFDEDGVYLKYPATDIRFSYLQPDEVLLARDIMNKQIVDTQGMKVVRSIRACARRCSPSSTPSRRPRPLPSSTTMSS